MYCYRCGYAIHGVGGIAQRQQFEFSIYKRKACMVARADLVVKLRNDINAPTRASASQH